jgi:hypothetical protein
MLVMPCEAVPCRPVMGDNGRSTLRPYDGFDAPAGSDSASNFTWVPLCVSVPHPTRDETGYPASRSVHSRHSRTRSSQSVGGRPRSNMARKTA